MNETRKITAFIPTKLLETAQSYTHQGVTETLRIALERLAQSEWSRQMLELRGTIKLDGDLAKLREDRAFDERGDVL
jgi:hypothetical protein